MTPGLAGYVNLSSLLAFGDESTHLLEDVLWYRRFSPQVLRGEPMALCADKRILSGQIVRSRSGRSQK